MPARQYSSTAGQMSLQAGINATDVTLTVDTVTGLPATTPFSLLIDKDTATEEVVTVTGVSGTTLTITRGVDGSAATPHSTGAIVVHGFSAQDFREPQEHIYKTSGVHGVTGPLVGTTDTQTLDNKVFVSTSGGDAPLKVRPKSGQTGSVIKIQNAAGSADVATFDASGRLTGPGITGNSTSTFTAGTNASNAVTLKGTTGQVAPVLSVRNSSSTETASIGAEGAVAATSVASSGPVSASAVSAVGGLSGASLNVSGTSASAVTATVTGAPSQTAKLTEWKPNGGAAVASVGVDGAVVAATVAATAATVTTVNATTVNATDFPKGSPVPYAVVGISGNTDTALTANVDSKANIVATYSSGLTVSGADITVPVAGLYRLHAHQRFAQVGGGSQVVLKITLNGAAQNVAYTWHSVPATGNVTIRCDQMVHLAAGDKLSIYRNATSSGVTAAGANIEFQGTVELVRAD